MSEETKKVGAAAEAPKLRRGVSNATQAVSQLKFHEKDAAVNGLFIGHLEDVRVEWSTNADGKMFTGMKVPRLVFHFTSEHTNVSEKRHVYQSLFPVESNVDTIPGGKEEWKVNQVLNWIKHLLDVFYLKGRALSEDEENALTLSFVDFNEAGEYVVVEPEDVLAGYAAVFTNAAAMLNGTFGKEAGAAAKPCFKDANGKGIVLWMKLLRHKKRKNEWINVSSNGDLAFDSFLGAGAIEIRKANEPPAILRLDLSKESITPKETKKTPTVGIPNAYGGVVAPGMAPGVMPQNDAFSEAQDEMPFF